MLVYTHKQKLFDFFQFKRNDINFFMISNTAHKHSFLNTSDDY